MPAKKKTPKYSNVDWTIGHFDGRNTTVGGAQLAVQQDIRNELRALNRKFNALIKKLSEPEPVLEVKQTMPEPEPFIGDRGVDGR